MTEKPYLDNPAGRLHNVLQRFGSHRESPIIAAWNSALGVEAAKVPSGLIGVAGLIDETKKAYESTGLMMFAELPGRLDQIGSMLFQTGQPMSAAARVILPPDFDSILQDILNLSRYLNQYDEQSKLPDEAEVADLVKTARDLIAAVTISDALVPELKALLIRQLSEALATLEMWWVDGPEKVRLEVLAVAATVAACEPEAANRPPGKASATFEPIKQWAAAALMAFALVNSGAQAINTGGRALGLLPPPAATQVDVEVEPEPPTSHAPPRGMGPNGHAPAERPPQ